MHRLSNAMNISLIYERDVGIAVRDGTVLRANVYRPLAPGRYPVVMSLGPYGKDRHLADRAPELARQLGGGPFLNWETPDPEQWVPEGYVVVRVDSRGSGQSPGFLAPFTQQIADDFHDAIEWAGVQEWSSGKVGTLGVSYYGATQWAAAARRPPHLAAMVAWEAFADTYRDLYRHGGILSNRFLSWWWPQTIVNLQHGRGRLPESVLEGNRLALMEQLRGRELIDGDYESWLPDPHRIEVPFLSVGNLGNVGLHLRGNVEAFCRAKSTHKWLRLIVGDHVLPAYQPQALELQRRFFARFLKDQNDAWQDEPRVEVTLRSAAGNTLRADSAWPLQDTRFTPLYLDAQSAASGQLTATQPSIDRSHTQPAGTGCSSFSTPPFTERTEVIGPVALRLWASSSVADMDIFVRLRKIDAKGRDEVGISPAGGHMALALGWLRASHRKLDAERSLPYRPVHTHDELQPLVPGEAVALDIEIWPTSILFEPGSRLVLEIAGHDFEKADPFGHGATPDQAAAPMPYVHFVHDDPVDRPEARFGGMHTLYTGPARPSHLLLPVVPATTTKPR
jgi:uncharacterized protein